MASRFRAQSFFPMTDNGITRWTDCKVRPIWGMQWESKREARAHTRIRIPGDGHEKSPYGHEKSLYRPRLCALVCRPWVRARAWHHSRTPSLLDHRGLATHPRRGARRITANVAKLPELARKRNLRPLFVRLAAGRLNHSPITRRVPQAAMRAASQTHPGIVAHQNKLLSSKSKTARVWRWYTLSRPGSLGDQRKTLGTT
jgi:hypothetical protein